MSNTLKTIDTNNVILYVIYNAEHVVYRIVILYYNMFDLNWVRKLFCFYDFITETT